MDNRDEQMKILLSAYLDGEVSAEERKMAEDYLASSEEARRWMAAQRSVSKALRSVPQEGLSPDVNIKIQNRVKRSREESPMKSNNLMPVFAVVVMLVVVGSFAFNHLLRSNIELAGRKRVSPFERTDIALNQPLAVDKHVESQIAFKSDSDEKKVLAESSQVMLAKVKVQDDTTVNEGGRTQGFFASSTPAKKEHSFKMVGAAPSAPASAELRLAGNLSYESYDMAVAVEPCLGCLPPVPSERDGMNTEEYQRLDENEFKLVSDNPLSTFSIDVDTASYANVRRYLNAGQMPPVDAVRIEEMINYFDYEYPNPEPGQPFSITTQGAVCPWNADHQLVSIGLKGKTFEKDLPPSNLVFLIDVSGSMNDADKLPLLKKAFGMMVRQLSAKERVAIVVYAGAAGKVLDSTPGDDKQTILNAIENLQAGGSTAGGQGIELAYRIAKENFIKGGNNRVILATDGDFNVGVSSTGDLTRLIEEKRKEGVFLTVLGLGTGNVKDSRMEQLANKGNGNYYYIDTEREAKKVLVQELGSTLFAIAKDVKIQIEFNPGLVKAYRLIGYETRMLAKEDFNDDTKDAGELGAGHTVTALYEIVPADSQETFGSVDPLKYQKVAISASDDVMTVKLRYKNPDEDASRLIERTLKFADIRQDLKGDFEFAAAVAEFGLLLRNSKFKGQSSYDHAIKSAKQSLGKDAFGYRQEFVDLVEKAKTLDLRGSEGILFKQ